MAEQVLQSPQEVVTKQSKERCMLQTQKTLQRFKAELEEMEIRQAILVKEFVAR